jgi:polyisoprenoid-binding protein YceI
MLVIGYNGSTYKFNFNDMENSSRETKLNDGIYAVATAASHLAWHGAKVIGNSHGGSVDIKSGQLTVNDGQLQGGSFIIDMSTIKSDEKIEALVGHLNSPDFFDTANYAEAKLEITGVAASEQAAEYLVKADLTIKGHTNPIEFKVQVTAEGSNLTAISDFTIDRSQWDVRFGSGKFFENLGDSMIKDEISFKVNLRAQLQ